MAQPEPGWYTDPQDAQQVRWWDGAAWSEQTKDRAQHAARVSTPIAAPAQAQAYVPMAGYGATRVPDSESRPTKKDIDRQIRKNNSMAYTGCVLALVSFLFNPFGILSVLGIVFGALGLAKSHELEGAGYKVTGRGTSIAAIVLGLFGIAFLAYKLTQLVG